MDSRLTCRYRIMTPLIRQVNIAISDNESVIRVLIWNRCICLTNNHNYLCVNTIQDHMFTMYMYKRPMYYNGTWVFTLLGTPFKTYPRSYVNSTKTCCCKFDIYLFTARDIHEFVMISDHLTLWRGVVYRLYDSRGNYSYFLTQSYHEIICNVVLIIYSYTPHIS